MSPVIARIFDRFRLLDEIYCDSTALLRMLVEMCCHSTAPLRMLDGTVLTQNRRQKERQLVFDCANVADGDVVLIAVDGAMDTALVGW